VATVVGGGAVFALDDDTVIVAVMAGDEEGKELYGVVCQRTILQIDTVAGHVRHHPSPRASGILMVYIALWVNWLYAAAGDACFRPPMYL
jgi:hypothetical protein